MENTIVVKIDSNFNSQGFTQLKTQLNDISENTKKASNEAEKYSNRMMMMGHIGASLYLLQSAFQAVTSTIIDFTNAYRVSEEAGARLDAVLKSTAYASGFTGAELKKFASSLQDVTTHEDDATIAMMSILSTFKMISGDTYTRAVKAIQDMSIVMGQDLKSSAVQVGKALNDPKEGISALTRAGVQFTDSQKNTVESLIKTGEVAKAQSIILAELESQFGGASQAIAQTTSGSLTQLQNKYGDLKEAFGEAFLAIGQQSGSFDSLKSYIDAATSAVKTFILNYKDVSSLSDIDDLTKKISLLKQQREDLIKNSAVKDNLTGQIYYTANAQISSLYYDIQQAEKLLSEARKKAEDVKKISVETQRKTVKDYISGSQEEESKKRRAELEKFNNEQLALNAKFSDKSFKQLDAGEIDYKEIDANAKRALDSMADTYQTYYETIGDYAKSWEIKKFELSEKYNMLSTEELDKFLGKQEELYFSSFTKQKTEAQQAAEAMYQAFNGIHRQLESSFMSFFDHTSDKFMEFGDLATSILNQIINEMIRMSIVTPMVNSLMGMIGPTLGIGTGTTSVSSATSVATVPQSFFRWKGGMFADGYLAGGGYASYDSIANDKIPALISKGEAVIPASVVNSNRELIASLIASRGQKFANGYMPHGSETDGTIKVQIINESGQDMNITSTRQSMDAEGMVLGIVIDGISKNKMGLRDMLGGR